mgnify:CR=1 FL=1
MDKYKVVDAIREAKEVVDEAWGIDGDSIMRGQMTLLVALEFMKEEPKPFFAFPSAAEIRGLPGCCEHCGWGRANKGFSCCPEGFHFRIVNQQTEKGP